LYMTADSIFFVIIASISCPSSTWVCFLIHSLCFSIYSIYLPCTSAQIIIWALLQVLTYGKSFVIEIQVRKKAGQYITMSLQHFFTPFPPFFFLLVNSWYQIGERKKGVELNSCQNQLTSHSRISPFVCNHHKGIDQVDVIHYTNSLWHLKYSIYKIKKERRSVVIFA
jgi:hypothetical protein